MPDVFNRTTDRFGGSFSSDQVQVTFPHLVSGGSAIGADVGLLMQQLATRYQQQVSRFYELSSPAIYLIGGRTQGNATMRRIIGPRAISTSFYTTYGDICQARSNTLSFSILTGTCGEAGSPEAGFDFLTGFVAWDAHFCVITDLGISIGAPAMQRTR